MMSARYSPLTVLRRAMRSCIVVKGRYTVALKSPKTPPLISFMIPMTSKLRLSTLMKAPIGYSSVSNSSCAVSVPMIATRALSSMSRSVMKLPSVTNQFAVIW